MAKKGVKSAPAASKGSYKQQEPESSSEDEQGGFDLGLDEYNSSDGSDDDQDDDDDDADGHAYNSEDDDDESGDGDDDDDSEEYDSDEDDNNDLKNLVNNLDPKMKQRVLRKKGEESDEEEQDSNEDDDSDDDQQESWGKKKKTYWEGDTGDLEIGQDFEDAEDEEAAAQDLNKQKLKRMTDADFFDDGFDNVGSALSSSRKGGEKMSMVSSKQIL